MTIQQKLEEEINKALKSQKTVAVGALRFIKSAVKNREIDLRHPLTDAEFAGVLSTLAKRHRESIEQFEKGGRKDLVQLESEQLKIVESFLPKALSEEELTSLIDEAVRESGAKGPKDMGLVMKGLKDKTAGRVDGSKLADAVKKKLATIS